MMLRISTLSLLLFLVSVPSGCIPTKKIFMAMQGNPFPGNTDSVQRGADLYATHCLSCHGAQARGGWSEAEAVKIQTPRIVDKSVSVIAYSAAYGKGAFMPAFEDQLTKEQLWDIANYVKSLE